MSKALSVEEPGEEAACSDVSCELLCNFLLMFNLHNPLHDYTTSIDLAVYNAFYSHCL